MSTLPPNTFIAFFKGMELATLTDIYAEAGQPTLSTGESAGWAWVTLDARADHTGRSAQDLAQKITGFRYTDRASRPDHVESVFLASTPACTCPHGQNYFVPHCDDHPFQFAYCEGGFGLLYFNLGQRRESRRTGDLLVGELLAAGIVGRETGYDTDPDFNSDGEVTLRIIVEHFQLPSPPLLPR
ncbi:hypothetical protein [Streptomyces sp. NPDC050738]|uniref:hypothetical protein n=1 Tax=Streptomyces sp. NPDC050738 TaxID=3154744 RepID=UPI003430F017